MIMDRCKAGKPDLIAALVAMKMFFFFFLLEGVCVCGPVEVQEDVISMR